jgi:hypothetical protein
VERASRLVGGAGVKARLERSADGRQVAAPGGLEDPRAGPIVDGGLSCRQLAKP